MRSHVNSLTLVVLAGLISAAFAQTGGAGEPATPSFPYIAEIVGDNLYVRSGPGTNFYHCGKLNTGAKVKVVSRQFSWSCIVPPQDSFSWISMQYVRIDPDDASVGIVTGDNVRVYAGSEYVKPLYSTTLQGKLSRGDKVKLLGEQMDDYYKIGPPSFAYLWVSTSYTKPIKPATPLPESVSEVLPPIKRPIEPIEPGDANDTVVVVTPPPSPPLRTSEETRLQQYNSLEKQLQAEQAKPVGEQDYSNIKKALTEIANDEQAGKAARYAQFVIGRIESFELALAAGKEIQLAREQLQKTRDRIDKARATKLAEVKDLGRFAIVGQLETFTTYGPGHYRILDESGKTVCYALPTGRASQADLSKLVGSKVGLVGMIEPHRQTAGALVRFAEIVELK
jgi:hypothetical protein